MFAKLIFLLAESFKALFRAKLHAVISSITIGIALVIFSIAYYSYLNLLGFSYEFKSKYRIEVFFESNLDFGYLTKLGEKSNLLTSVNGFFFDEKYDFNNDNFTDLTLQKRVSLFNKLQWKNDSNQTANMVLRYVYEDRWGGEMNWNPSFRGADQVYGESIYTNRFEFLGNQPVKSLNLQY